MPTASDALRKSKVTATKLEQRLKSAKRTQFDRRQVSAVFDITNPIQANRSAAQYAQGRRNSGLAERTQSGQGANLRQDAMLVAETER